MVCIINDMFVKMKGLAMCQEAFSVLYRFPVIESSQHHEESTIIIIIS